MAKGDVLVVAITLHFAKRHRLVSPLHIKVLKVSCANPQCMLDLCYLFKQKIVMLLILYVAYH